MTQNQIVSSLPAPNERFYRQVGRGGNPTYYEEGRGPSIHSSVFLPNRCDIDGLSIISCQYRRHIWAAFRKENPDERYRLIVLEYGLINSIAHEVGLGDLHVTPTPDSLDCDFGEPWAHCIIQEINRQVYDKDVEIKKKIKSWAQLVANNIQSPSVIGPFAKPEPGVDQYRP